MSEVKTDRLNRFAKELLKSFKRTDKISKMDDRELLWCLKAHKVWESDDDGVFDMKSDLVDALETRLYPEYDGDKVTWEEWGWKTENGEIRY